MKYVEYLKLLLLYVFHKNDRIQFYEMKLLVLVSLVSIYFYRTWCSSTVHTYNEKFQI